MFYRQASTGQVPGVRLAAVDPASAEYLAEKIAQIESGEPPAGHAGRDRAEAPALSRPGAVRPDRQGLPGRARHPRHRRADPGSSSPTATPSSSASTPRARPSPAERRRRQQEVENLLERYIERSDDGTAGRPVALLLTKFDRVMARGEAGQGPDAVERLVEARYGMTRHALARHVPRGAMFAVSSYGPGAVDGRPPAELHPLGLEGPLGWLAEQLEAVDREQLEWLWDLAPDDLPRLARCVAAFERRYPNSDRAEATSAGGWPRRRRKRARRTLAGFVAGLAAGRRRAGRLRRLGLSRGRRLRGATTPRRRSRPAWDDLLAWHPTLPLFLPRARPGTAQERAGRVGRQGRRRPRRAPGTAEPDLAERLRALQEERPELAIAIAQGREEPRGGPARRPLARGQGRGRRLGRRARRHRPGRSAASSASSPTRPTAPRPTPCSLAHEARVDERQSTASGGSIDDLARSAEPAQRRLPRPDRAGPPVPRRAPREPLSPRGRAAPRRLRQDPRRPRHRPGPRVLPRVPDRIRQAGSKATATTSRPTQGAACTSSEATEAKDRILRELGRRHLPAGLRPSRRPPRRRRARSPRQLRDYLQQHPDGRRVAAAKRLPRLVGQGHGRRRLPGHAPPGRVRPDARQDLPAGRPTSA